MAHIEYYSTFMLLIFIIFPSTFSQDPPIVQTKSGAVIGTTVRFQRCNLEAYLGVPYASPPTGDLRFRRTVPVTPWCQPIFTTTLPPACPQLSLKPYPWYTNETYQSEDCLFMNIWVPSCPDKPSYSRKAVLYWLHGGSLEFGSARQEIFDGRALAATGDIIVVTINYRLGPLGFLYSGSEDAPGNLGLYDMLEGLKWINNNIEAFGGDKNRITIFGQSSGSTAVGLLMLSPLADGLFNRAIMESESPLLFINKTRETNLERAQILSKALDCANDSFTIQDYPKEVVRCLKDVDAMEMIRISTLNLQHFEPERYEAQFGDSIVPEEPTKQILSGRFRNMDLLIGTTRNEGSGIVTILFPEIFGFFGHKQASVNKTLGSSLLRQALADFPNLDAAVNYYLGDLQEYDYDNIKQRLYLAFGEHYLVCPQVFFAEEYSERNSAVYYYSFVHRPSTTLYAEEVGVAHFEEVQFVFGRPELKPFNYTIPERDLSRRVMKVWANFAKGISDPTWPIYRKKQPIVKLFDIAGASPDYSPHETNCDFFRP